MDINNQSNQELLSAYLDGALTDEELVQVERWLATDTTAVRYLNSLRSNRHTLQALANLPVAARKLSFAERVLAQTHGTDATFGETRGNQVRLPEAVPAAESKNWWAWSVFAATAAAVTWLALVPVTRAPEKDTLLSQYTIDEPDKRPEVLPPVVPEQPSIPGPSGDLLTDALSPGGKPRGADELHQLDKPMTMQLLLIGDVLMSESAWNEGKFDELLEKHGVRYDKELVAERALIEGLIEGQVTVGPSGDPTKQQDAALVYVDCPAEALAKIMVEIENDSTNFIGLTYNAAMGGGGLGRTPYDKMLSALRSQTGISSGRGIARLILPKNPKDNTAKLLPGFEVPIRTVDKASRNSAANKVARSGSFQGNLTIGNANGEVLLILRKQ